MTIIHLPSRTVDTDQRFKSSLTIQEVFDNIVYHLGTMPEQSYNTQIFNKQGRPTCMYRNTDGNSCAVGRMIADDEYSRQMECHTVSTIVRKHTSMKERLEVHLDLLADLQVIHDEPANWTGNRRLMKEKLLQIVRIRKDFPRDGLDYEMINHPDMIWNKEQ